MDSNDILNKLRSLNNDKLTIPNEKLALPYIRVSTEKQADLGFSIDQQKDIIKKYCDQHNLEIEEYFIDEGISGKTTEKRPAFQRMISKICVGCTIISYSMSRISRSVNDFSNLYKEIKNRNAHLVLIEMPNLGGLHGDFLLTLLSGLAQLESDQISYRVKNVMQFMSENKTLIKKPLYGYKVIIDENGEKKVVEEESEQLVIQYVKSLIENNPNIPDSVITQDLKNKGIKMRKSKTIYQATVKKLIKDNNLR